MLLVEVPALASGRTTTSTPMGTRAGRSGHASQSKSVVEVCVVAARRSRAGCGAAGL